MEQLEERPSDGWVACLKTTQFVLNSAWLFAALFHFYDAIQDSPFSSGALPMELLFLLTILLHVLNIVLPCHYGCIKLYTGIGCLFLENLILFLIVFVAYFMIRYLYNDTLVKVMLDLSLCFIQSLVFLKCIYIRSRSTTKPIKKKSATSLLKQLKVKSLPRRLLRATSNQCAICLDQMRSPAPGYPGLIQLPCTPTISHCFHFECFVKWFQNSQQCPICRGKRYLSAIKKRRKNQRILPDTIPDTETRIVPSHIPGNPSTDRLTLHFA